MKVFAKILQAAADFLLVPLVAAFVAGLITIPIALIAGGGVKDYFVEILGSVFVALLLAWAIYRNRQRS